MKKLFVISMLSILVISCSKETPTNINQFEFNFPADCCPSLTVQVNGIESLASEGIKFYNACVFAPDGTTNNTCYIQTNDQINQLSKLEVTDQKGTLIFQKENIQTNEQEDGWDGRIDGIAQEGPFKISFGFTSVSGKDIEVSYIICALLCEDSLPAFEVYRNQGLDYNNLRWPSQHDGGGDFDFTAPIYFCD